MPRLCAHLFAGVVAITLAACSRPVAPTRVVDRGGPLTMTPAEALADAKALDVPFAEGLRLVGVKVPASVPRGSKLGVTLLFAVEGDVSTRKPMVGLHLSAPGAEIVQIAGDHGLLRGGKPAEWQRGDLLLDVHEVAIPDTLGVDELALWAGLREGQTAWVAKAPSGSAADKHGRFEVARVKVEGAPSAQVSAQVPRAKGAITIDGKLDEADWATALVLGPFVAWDGRSSITRGTKARMLWTPDALYLAFEGQDPDVFTPYKKHDDPIYESEAVEIFIDADGDQDVYVELQSAPNDVTFDAAFAGGRRKNMDTSYEAGHQVKTVVDGTFGDGKDEDRGFVSEWRIPVAALKDVPAGEPKVGASWRINLFRLERLRTKDRVTASEASAWSTPLSGDFHNLARFGTVTFVD